MATGKLIDSNYSQDASPNAKKKKDLDEDSLPTCFTDIKLKSLQLILHDAQINDYHQEKPWTKLCKKCDVLMSSYDALKKPFFNKYLKM